MKIPIVKEPFPHGGLPGKGRMAGEVQTTPELAKAEGYRVIRDYEAKDRFGNMGVFIGVAEVDGGYRAVINLYHSNT